MINRNPIPGILVVLTVTCVLGGCAATMQDARTDSALESPSYKDFTAKKAAGFNRTANSTLAPVYPPLAEYLVKKYDLAEKRGIGIDIGSGPGSLIVEICKRTKYMYWINADINTYYFNYFFKAAAIARVAHRVGAVFTDAGRFPFRDNYADVVISRGSFQFWPDKRAAFAEIYRVLKPGGAAYIGRGFSENLPLKTAERIRKNQGKGPPKYNVVKTKARLEKIMADLNIADYEIIIPRTDQKKVNYGIWLSFKKSAK